MPAPAIENVIHIPYITLQKYFSEHYDLNGDGSDRNRVHYDDWVLDNHMFRGNDSSMGFYNAFMNEGVDETVLEHFNYLDKALLDGLTTYDHEDDIAEWIRNYGVDNWAREYKKLLANRDATLTALGEDNKYWWGYFVNGIYTAMVISLYQLDEFDKWNYYYWYFTW